MSTREFPIMGGWSRARHATIPGSTIPWDMIAPHEEQAKANHAGQSLEGLAARGGLDRSEAIAVLTDRAWERMDEDRAVEVLSALVDAWIAKHPNRL